MADISSITEFGKILIFLITGLVFIGFAFGVNKILAPHHPNPEKNTSYECGEETTGNSWVQFNSRFYVIALIFLLFDVEMIFVFPWATVFSSQDLIQIDSRWGWFSFIEMLIFIGILLLGLIYVWIKKDLDWIKPKSYIPSIKTAIPIEAYQAINQNNYIPNRTKASEIKEIPLENKSEQAPALPKFTPRFKKT